MNGATEKCVDANLAVKVILKEPGSHLARALFGEWAAVHAVLIAPCFFVVEIDSILRKKVILLQELTPEQGEEAFAKAQKLPIQLVSEPKQRQRAWELAVMLGLPTTYDATYLAVAELRGAEFWTADERLFNKVKAHLNYARWLGNYIPQGCFGTNTMRGLQ